MPGNQCFNIEPVALLFLLLEGCWLFETGFHSHSAARAAVELAVAQAAFELMAVCLPQPPE